MKSLYLFFAILLIAPTLYAQKVDIDAEPVPVHFLRLPERPLPASYQFYSTIVSSKPGDLEALGMSEATLQKYLKVPGYQKIEKGGHFNLELTLEDFAYEGKTETKTETTTTKDKTGKEIKTTYYYCITGYKQPIILRVRDADGKQIEERRWQKFPRQYRSEQFTNYKEFERFVADRLRREVAKKTQNEILAAMAEAQQLLSENYGYAPIKNQVKLEILDTEKHPDYGGFQSAYQTAKNAFSLMQPTAPLDSVNVVVKPAIQFFEQQKDKYDASDKNGKKLKYACLYDLALIYFWLEDFDQATTYANAVITNDYEPKSGKRMLEDIENLKASMQKCGHNTRHFMMQIDSSAIPAVAETVYDSDKSLRVEAYKDDKKDIGANTVQMPGVIYYTDGQESHGTFLMDGPQRFFEDKSNTRFSVESATNAYVSVPNFSKISRFTIGDRLFRLIPFKSANTASLGGKASVQIMEVLYESPKIAAYLAYTGDRRGLNTPAEYVLHNIVENEMTSLNGLKFALNLNKGIRKEYGACKAVTDVLDKDGFKRTPEGIAELAKVVEGCME